GLARGRGRPDPARARRLLAAIAVARRGGALAGGPEIEIVEIERRWRRHHRRRREVVEQIVGGRRGADGVWPRSPATGAAARATGGGAAGRVATGGGPRDGGGAAGGPGGRVGVG